MSNALLHLLLTKHQQQISCAIDKVRMANSMRAVKHASTISTRPEIRYLPQAIIETRRLTISAEQKMKLLLKQQITALSAHDNHQDLKQAIAKHFSTDWCYLRGDFANCFYEVQRESSRLIFQLTKQNKRDQCYEQIAPNADEITDISPKF